MLAVCAALFALLQVCAAARARAAQIFKKQMKNEGQILQ
jgi:predicted secreted Zn-dependent protease